MVYSRGIAVLQHLGMGQENLRPLRYIQMWSGVAEGVGGGGYDCFPALAAAGIERAAGEGGREGGRERDQAAAWDRGKGGRGEVGSAQLLDGWMDGTEGAAAAAAGEECTQLVHRLIRAVK